MNIDPQEVFGEENMDPARKEYVIAQIQQLPLSRDYKRVAFLRWCDRVGVKADDADLRRVLLKPTS